MAQRQRQRVRRVVGPRDAPEPEQSPGHVHNLPFFRLSVANDRLLDLRYDRWSPRLHKSANALFYDWADAILFASSQFTVTSDGKAKAVGADGGRRVLRAIGGPAVVAKNRYSLPAELPLQRENGWQVLSEAIFK